MDQKYCRGCESMKGLDKFSSSKRAKDGKQDRCKECAGHLRRSAKQKLKDKGVRSYAQKYRRRLRLDVLRHYGGPNPKCECCGEPHYEFLGIDHVGGGGNKHRRAIGGNGHLYQWLKSHGYPEGYRVLCHNCNQSIGLYGYCPHGLQKPVLEERSLTEITRDNILSAARLLADSNVYPSLPRLITATGHSPSIISRHRRLLLEQKEWPMRDITIQKTRHFTPNGLPPISSQPACE